MKRQLTLTFCCVIALLGMLFFGRIAHADNYVRAVENQLLILGTPPEIQQALQPIAQQVDNLNVAPMNWFQMLPPSGHPLAGQPNVQMHQLLIFDPTLTVEDALQQIAGTGAFVFASPNWVTAAAGVWYIEGAPSVPAVVTTTVAPLNTQVGFAQVGYTTTLAATGERVQVGIFDTSPYQSDGTFPAAVASLPLTVHHEFTLPSPSPVPTTTIVDEHGTAVASLSGAVAESADYHLYRVLNNGGVGDLFTLNAALSSFIDDSIIQFGNGLIDGAVINLSLVVHAPLGDPVPPLDVVLAGADVVGIPIIAAAGNESDEFGALPPKVPASYPYTLAVSGVNSADLRACFSHIGDIAGFSGETFTNGTCDPPTMTQRIRTAAIGDSRQLEWAGTSFATPLVTAGAILLLDKFDGQPPTAHVNDVLRQTARVVDAGSILDLHAALNEVPLAVTTRYVHATALNRLLIFVVVIGLCSLSLWLCVKSLGFPRTIKSARNPDP